MTAEPASVSGPGSFVRLAERLAGLRGWRRHGAAAACGVLATAALPPLHLFPLLIPAFVGLLWLLDGVRRPRNAALVGWSFGFGHFLSGLYWVGHAFLVDVPRFGWMMPFAVAGLAAGMAAFPAFATAATVRAGARGPARTIVLALAWLVSEWLRSWILTGFPWNLLGTVWSFSPAMLQLAAATGVWGLSVMTVLAAAAPAALVDAADSQAGAGRRRTVFAAAMLLLPLAVWGGGALRLAAAAPVGEKVVEGVRLRLVQASVPQTLKWDPALRRRHVEAQMRLSVRDGRESVTHVIWPETAVPYLLTREPDLERTLARVVPDGGLLLTGAPRAGGDAGRRKLWNSLHALDARGEIAGTYDKHHLVPFGEYMPLRGLFGLSKLTAGSVDFSAGPGLVTLDLQGLPPFSPLICYEAIFPGQVAARSPRPAWLLNVTNDAWFGVSSGPYQHFASARLRAVEEGLPLVRAANTGISAVVDPYGRILGRLGLGAVGILDSVLPRPASGITLYARIGNFAVLLLALGTALFALISHRFLP